MKLSSWVILATFQVLKSHLWTMATVPDCANTERFHQHRRFYWTYTEANTHTYTWSRVHVSYRFVRQDTRTQSMCVPAPGCFEPSPRTSRRTCASSSGWEGFPRRVRSTGSGQHRQHCIRYPLHTAQRFHEPDKT